MDRIAAERQCPLPAKAPAPCGSVWNAAGTMAKSVLGIRLLGGGIMGPTIKRWGYLLLCAAAVAAFTAGAQVRVKGHFRKNGTYVAPHYRSAPNSSRLDNYSTRGNYNPYTGKRGTANPYSQTNGAGHYRAPAFYWQEPSRNGSPALAASDEVRRELNALGAELEAADPAGYQRRLNRLLEEMESIRLLYPPNEWVAQTRLAYRRLEANGANQQAEALQAAQASYLRSVEMVNEVNSGIRSAKSLSPEEIAVYQLFSAATTVQKSTFHGDSCRDDCSGHEAGYRWAEDNDIDDPDDCGGNSASFIEGCQAWAEEQAQGDEEGY